MKAAPIMPETLFGSYSIRTWLEVENDPGGGFRYVGMGMVTHYDRNGKVLSVDIKPSGVVLTTADTPKRRGLFARLADHWRM